ncbi:hypothetical protein ACFPFX_32865 [Streptomyces mauvecolor]|uniref:Uncharacterized protein n=1 Tax=Streptomyces mauvecolor TaxID=58345 RepID=A0ABV9UXC8_9ACTN
MTAFCTGRRPEPGTVFTFTAKDTRPKFYRLHGRRMGLCPACHRIVPVLTRGSLTLLRHRVRAAN